MSREVNFTQWENVNNHTLALSTAMLDNLRIQVKIEYDIDHDWSWRGTFTDRWQVGAVKNPDAKYDRNVFKYFAPVNTVHDHIKSLLETGASLQEARKKALQYVREDMAIIADPESRGYGAVGVIVTVSTLINHGELKQWEELATDSLYGIETTASYPIQEDEYIKQIMQECFDNALAMTKHAVEQIKAIF